MNDKSLESRVKSQKPAIALRSNSGSRLLTLGPRLSRGMTLIELLVVIVILTTIVGAAIPLMSPSNDDRRLREAARGVNTYITGAQTRAIAAKRPHGVALKRLSQDTKRDKAGDLENDNGVCLELFYVEQPVPYAGFDENSSKARVTLGNAGTVLIQFVRQVNPDLSTVNATTLVTSDSLPLGFDVDPLPPSLVRPGDVVLINGTRYRFIEPEDDFDKEKDGFYSFGNSNQTTVMARPLNDSGQIVNLNPVHDGGGRVIRTAPTTPYPSFWTQPAPYKIIRQPTPTSDEPYQLPEGTAIDLRASGVGVGDYFYWPGLNDNSNVVIIMFAPEGRVERVSYSQLPITSSGEDETFDQSKVDNVYLLVGRRENIPGPDAGADPTLSSTLWANATTDEARAKLRQPLNWLGGSSRWVVIGSQMGRITTIENAFVDPAVVMANPQAPFATASESTELMRAAQILATREFTREMARVGGR